MGSLHLNGDLKWIDVSMQHYFKCEYSAYSGDAYWYRLNFFLNFSRPVNKIWSPNL